MTQVGLELAVVGQAAGMTGVQRLIQARGIIQMHATGSF